MFNNRKCALIGVVHVLPLPGSAGYDGDMQKIVRMAIEDASKYVENGIDALILENMHDTPYLKGFVEPETTAAMTVVAQAVKAVKNVPCGMQLLAGANIEALGVAVAASLDFVRVEGFVYAHVGDEGIHESCAAKLIRRRASLKAEHIKIFADIKKKHSAHAITSDVSLAETAHAAEFFKADGVIVTGSSTGIAPETEDVATARRAVSTAVLVGSGVTAENVGPFVEHSDALIVGSSLKYDGKWNNHVDAARVRKL
ncbi:MAG TPA: BtpA/SgcQ family protein, partial [Candidatus Obscuribacterales bacterium]